MFMIAPLAVAGLVQAGVALGGAAVKYGRGRKQAKQAKKLAAMPRPEKEVSRGAQDAYKKAALAASGSKMPGQVRIEEMMGQQAADTASAAQASGSPYATINAASAAQGQHGNQLNKLGVSAAANRQDRTRFAEQMRGNLIQSEEAALDYNKFAPYNEAKAAESALRGAAMQNTQGALNTAGQAASTYFTNRAYSQTGGAPGGGSAQSSEALAQGAQSPPQYGTGGGAGGDQNMSNELAMAKSHADRQAILARYGYVK